jgi:hypothetical protein
MGIIAIVIRDFRGSHHVETTVSTAEDCQMGQ